jgi:hypothetical protein
MPVFVALRKKAGFEVVSHNDANPNQLRILGRVPEDRGGLNMNNWKILMYRLYLAMEGQPWKVDFSKSYFIKAESKKLVFAWRVILQGEGLTQHYADIVNLITTSPISAPTVVTEMPLVGVSADRNSTEGGKRGAGVFGKVLTGPLAVNAKNMGG